MPAPVRSCRSQSAIVTSAPSQTLMPLAVAPVTMQSEIVTSVAVEARVSRESREIPAPVTPLTVQPEMRPRRTPS